MSSGPWEHPWRPQSRNVEQSVSEALWAIAAELRELNERMEDDDE